MRIASALLALVILAAPSASAAGPRTYIGVITDTMCVRDHAAMKITPDAKCVQDCVRDARTFHYALLDGTNLYRLSDQETPAQYAGKKVKITGVLYTRTNIIKVEKIETVRE